MNFQSLHLLMLPLILLLTIPHSHCAWKPYTRFIGYIPSYTYPITLNAGDTLRGFLTWPGTQDLDIYLYRSGMDLLSRSTYLDRQFSPTLNPEDLVYTIPATDLYYLRVDLYSSVPTPYQFQIYVNGQIISTFFDTVITVTSGRTAQQFSVTGPCQIRVKYDGPVYNIYLFTPGTNVITGSPVASDTTAVNPKYITHLLTSGGLWNIVIHHGLTSTTTLTPFEIVVETELGANECLNLCSGIPYSEGIIYGLTSTCDCQTGFSWISSNQTCSIDCPSFNTSGVTGNRINSTADQCQCTNPAFTWNTTYLMCVVDCNLVPFANGPDGNQSCLCRSGFEWDSATLLCVKNCSSFAFTAGVSAMNVSECDCINSFYWDPSLSACFINCTSIPYTTYSAVNLVWFCLCQSNFYWNSFTHECNIDCTAFSGVLPIVINGTVDVCQCVLSNRMWNSSTFECQLNCSSIEYSSGLQNTNSCLCENKFAWNPAQQKCVIGCDALNYTVSPYWVINSTNSCQCLDGYIWDATSLLCFIN